MYKRIAKGLLRRVRVAGKPVNEYLRNKGFRIRALYSRYLEKYNVDHQVILYESYHGKNFTGNPLAIFLKLLQDDEFKDFTHVIVVNQMNPLVEQFLAQPNVKIVAVHQPDYLKYLATAKYLINNTSFPFYFIKRDEQVYINTWHGTPLKTLGTNIKNAGMTDHKNIQRNLLQTDFLVSPNKFTYEKLLTSHDIKEIFAGKIADIGYPRVDLTYKVKKQDVLEFLTVPSGKKVVLYAPTWRGTVGKESDMSKKLLEEVTKLKELLGNDYAVLLKSHYFAYRFFEENNLEHLCIPSWYDTNMLLAGVDVLITDYSSIFFEFLHTNKPVIFYGDDIEQYEEERGFYLSLESLPGPMCRKISDVVNYILDEETTKKIYQEKYEDYKLKYCYHDDGQASKRFVDIVFRQDQEDRLISTLTNKKKILMYCGAFYNNGITMSALTLLDHIDYDKYEVVVIENHKGKDEKWNNMRQVNNNVHFIYRPGELNRTLLDSYRHQLTLFRGTNGRLMSRLVPRKLYNLELKRLIGNTRFDIAINFGGYNDFWSLLFAFSDIKQKVIYLHNDMAEEYNKKINGRYKHKKNLRVVFSTYKYYDKIISVAPSTHEINYRNLSKFVPKAAERMTYVNNLVNSNKVRRLQEQNEMAVHNEAAYLVLETKEDNALLRLKATVLPNSDEMNFVSIGRLSPEKDHEKLIRAFHTALTEEPNMKLYIVGEGPLKGYLQMIINDLGVENKVFLTGQVENPFALLEKCDCFILSSNYEGQGLVLLEAMIIGKPIIATDVTGVRSVLDGGYGILIENSETALAQSIIDFVKRFDGYHKLKRFDFLQYNREALERFEKIVLNQSG
ncbi:glycosyltransferase [Bacillus rubiinfantis]|uniref:glycosyltransferase n=1 Tax=Bacillus rubiinfantis TaxID=1499680 RepID=UPI0016528AFA|nr:glycosyltransferase [Bacillus rubiinfantis]